jgi:hypothetical protein
MPKRGLTLLQRIAKQSNRRFCAPKLNFPTFIIGTLDADGNLMSVKKTVVGASPFEAFKAAIDPLLAAN